MIEGLIHCEHGRTTRVYCADCHVIRLQEKYQATDRKLEYAIESMKEAIVESGWGDAENALDKVIKILKDALKRVAPSTPTEQPSEAGAEP